MFVATLHPEDETSYVVGVYTTRRLARMACHNNLNNMLNEYAGYCGNDVHEIEWEERGDGTIDGLVDEDWYLIEEVVIDEMSE